MHYGDRVFRALEPIFTASICSAYKSDFTERDKQYLQRIAVPGFDFLWVIRENGTHIIPLGHDRDWSIECLTGVAGHPDDLRSFYHILCTGAEPQVRRLDRQTAFQVAGTSTPFSLVYHGPSQHVTVRFQEQLCATALIWSKPRPMDGNHYVACRAKFVQGLSPVRQMLTKLLIEQTFSKVVGSLFVRIDEFLIDDVPMYEWEQARTIVPVKQLSLIDS